MQRNRKVEPYTGKNVSIIVTAHERAQYSKFGKDFKKAILNIFKE